MKRFCKRFLSILLIAVMAATLLPSSLWSGSDTETALAASSDEEDTESESSSEESEEGEVTEDSSTITSTTTVDEDGNVISSTQMTQTSDGEITEESTDSSQDETDSENIDSSSQTTDTEDSSATAEDSTSSESSEASDIQTENETIQETSDETYSRDAVHDVQTEETEAEDEFETTTTYKLVITVTTTATSSSDDSVRTLKVTKPKLTTTVTTTNLTTGESTSESTTKTYGLTVKCHVPTKSWNTATTKTGYYTYTAPSGYYIQAVRITPSDNLKSAMKKAGLTFYYRATTEYFGTLGWAKAGLVAGTTGQYCPMTGLTLKVVTTGEASSLSTANRYISKPIVTYRTKYTGSSSWSSSKQNGSTAGTTSSDYSIGSLAVKLDSSYSFSGSIKYSIRTSTTESSSNWSSYTSDYSTAGSKNSKIKAIKIKLTGDMADNYNIYYRVYINGYGWLGWAKNGERAGTKGVNFNISAVQIKLVPKGADAPGSTKGHFISTSVSTKLNMTVKIQNMSSSSKYLLVVDRDACRVGIFEGSKGDWDVKYYWQCCVGKSSTPTPAGTYTVGIKEYSFGTSSYTCYYATQISGNYLFHSVLYKAGTFTIKDGTMGEAVSHGCVRLTLSHAKWIYKNIPTGTKIYIY